MLPDLTVGFIGAGKMASTLARGFLRADLVKNETLYASDPVPESRVAFEEATGVQASDSNLETAKRAQVLVLAVKPNQIVEALAEVRAFVTPEKLVISIAAGVPISVLEGHLDGGARVIRVMPNTPALVGASATAFALGHAATDADCELAKRLFSAVGVAFAVKEELLDAVTGLSGSGPAYVYLAIEALSDGGVAAGLPREIALKLAAQTVLGGAKMVLETGMHPGALKDMVASPGGTTIEGIHQLEKGGFRGLLMNAVRAAAEKSHRLGEG